MGTLLVDGREIRCNAIVRSDARFRFAALGKRTTTRAVVVHHTAGKGSHHQVYSTLVKRGLSVHFCVNGDGEIWQYADASLRCSHAGAANSWSVGIEVVNPAREIPVRGDYPRQVVVEEIHGVDVRHTTFTAEQVKSVLALTEALCRAYGLPHEVPMANGDVVATALPRDRLEAWRGVLGHLHVTTRKLDPGLAVLRAIAAQQARRANGLGSHA